MRRKSRKNSKPFKNTAKYSTTDFLKILAVIIDDPGNQSFQWGDGGSVVVNGEFYEEELSRCNELSTLKELKDVTGLHTSMLAYGFKKKARMSRGNIHVFQHPHFSIKSAHLKKDVKRESEGTGPSSRSRTQRQKPLRKTSDQCLMDHQHSPSSSHLFPPAKRKARRLYQYINNEFTLPDSHHSEETPNVSSADTQSSSDRDRHLEQQPIDLHTATHDPEPSMTPNSIY
ncbi:hypothetical protein R3I93_007979 [Phoxinus phoxinus]|uniref:HSF-type DNA-binding domain-containing protein n=1 Tax=Phoxinus phoxinus TaxID=58324 RepID=A0AAN9D343_9TELE